VVVDTDDIDLALPDKLALESAYVLSWVFAGYQAWAEGGLTPPEPVIVSTSTYRAESDPVARYIEARVMSRTAGSTPASDLYDDFTTWCKDNGERAVNTIDFAKALRGHGIDRVRTRRGNEYLISLYAPESPAPSDHFADGRPIEEPPEEEERERYP
jgi:putative DNA primase/helicase